ncbi:hypothetical protein CWE25_13275 [Idiomarina fontislapidosi]|uniref:Uncharacterized protein n=1 Tax=Idiomarina fontislapidosi TaxID=263723 RepID=A0A432XHR3_9GAMM|nr:hypothetical protein CWE25_13275 [Idiomarina fontislapidosi]
MKCLWVDTKNQPDNGVVDQYAMTKITVLFQPLKSQAVKIFSLFEAFITGNDASASKTGHQTVHRLLLMLALDL